MPLLARDVMTTAIVAVPPSLPLTELEDALVARRIGGAPVVENGRLVGIVSRSDIVRYFTLQRAMAEMLGERGRGPGRGSAERHLAVRDVMAKDPIVVPPDAPIDEVARRMATRHVHRVLVTDGDTVVGLISALDLAQLVADGRLRPA